MGFTRGLDPLATMGLDGPTYKVIDWIKKYKISYIDPEYIRRKKK
jgi:hypothetical protein